MFYTYTVELLLVLVRYVWTVAGIVDKGRDEVRSLKCKVDVHAYINTDM